MTRTLYRSMPSAATAAKTDATTDTYFSIVAEFDGVEVVPAVLPLPEMEGDTTVLVLPELKILT